MFDDEEEPIERYHRKLGEWPGRAILTAFGTGYQNYLYALAADANKWIILTATVAQADRDSPIHRITRHPLYERRLWALIFQLAIVRAEVDEYAIEEEGED